MWSLSAIVGNGLRTYICDASWLTRLVLETRGAQYNGETRDFLRPLVLDGAWSKAMEAITSGVVLAGLALYLGAGPFVIGLVAASPFFAQFTQFAGLRLVFVVRDRRKVTLVAAFASRLLLAGVGLIALAGPSPWALPTLVILLTASGCLTAIASVSWAFWMRDLVPQHVYGETFSRRFSAQAIVSVVLTLAAGVGLSYAMREGAPGLGFAIFFFAGCAFGIVSLVFASRLPKIPMNPADIPPSAIGLLRAVWVTQDRRDVILFIVAWTSAAFLGIPFVTVFLLREVGLGFALVSGFSAIAMVASLATYRFWGKNADRFGTRAVLALAIPAAAIALLVLPIAAGQDRWHLLALGVVFLVSGASFAAVDVAVAKLIARKAPFTGAGTFLAGAGIIRAFAAGVSTLLGGIAAGVLAGRELRLQASWGASTHAGTLSGYAFLFLASVLLMLYAWHRVLALRDDERGDVRDVLHEAQVELTGLAPFRGVRIMGHFAGHLATHVMERRHRTPPPHQRGGAGAVGGVSPLPLRRISR